MKLKCQCCGFEQEFDSREAAFQAGWDAPPHFTGYVTCNLCPGVCIVMGLSHDKAARPLAEVRQADGLQSRYVRTGCGVGAFQRPAVF